MLFSPFLRSHPPPPPHSSAGFCRDNIALLVVVDVLLLRHDTPHSAARAGAHGGAAASAPASGEASPPSAGGGGGPVGSSHEAPSAPRGSAARLVVANTHLVFNPKRGDIKTAQLMMLTGQVERWVKGGAWVGGRTLKFCIP